MDMAHLALGTGGLSGWCGGRPAAHEWAQFLSSGDLPVSYLRICQTRHDKHVFSSNCLSADICGCTVSVLMQQRSRLVLYSLYRLVVYEDATEPLMGLYSVWIQ